MEKVTLTFHPQVCTGRKNDIVIPALTRSDVSWEVDACHVENIEEGTYEADNLRNLPETPKWIRDWDGPFEITWNKKESL